MLGQSTIAHNFKTAVHLTFITHETPLHREFLTPRPILFTVPNPVAKNVTKTVLLARVYFSGMKDFRGGFGSLLLQ